VNGSAIVNGNLTVNGTTTTINSNTISIDDKTIELAAVVTTTFACTVQNNSTTISGVTPVSGLIPGMVVSSISAGISVPAGTVINSITGNTVVLSNVVTGSTGTASFEAVGPSDTAANGGGLVLKGTVDKTILYDNTRTDKYWVFTENLELALNKKFVIGNQLVLNTTTLGPTVVSSSLTTVGTLSGLTVNGNATFDTNTLFVDAANDKVGVGVSSGLTGTLTVLNPPANVNANTLAGLGLDVQAPWMRIGDANSGGNTGGRTFTNGVGIKFHDNGIAHYSAGINSSNFVIANTSTQGDQLFPSGFTPGITLTTSNNVGIGLTNPTAKLHTVGTSYFDVTSSTSDTSFYILGNKVTGQGAIAHIRSDAVSAGDNVFGGIKFSSSPGADFIIGKNSRFGSGYLEVRRETGDTLLSIDGNGNVTLNNSNLVIGTSGKGIDFSANANASGMTSELLDDYEEGTFTVTPNTNLTLDSSYTTWFYTKIGRQVTISGLFRVSSVSGTNGVTGSLPFVSATSPANGTGAYAGGTMSTGVDIGDAGMAWYIAGGGSNVFTFYRIFDNGGWDQLPNSALAPNDEIYVTMTYFTSS